MRTISNNIQPTCVFISDPSFFLSKSLTLGWYGGSEKDPLQPLLSKIINFLIEKFKAKRSLFFGGSAGGFASLYYSKNIENSLALIWNPQIILKNYYEHIVDRYAHTAFKADAKSLGKHLVADLAGYYKKDRGKNKIVYMQNVSDHHVEKHLQPFLGALDHDYPKGIFSDWLDPSFYLHVTDWSQGHTPPPRKLLQHLLEKFSDSSFDWSKDNIRLEMHKAEDVAATYKA